MATAAQFVWTTCQVGAERAVKGELVRTRPELHLSYSRPGFITFKLAGESPEAALPEGVFVRSSAWSLGKAAGERGPDLANEVWRIAGDQKFDRLHVWQRDLAAPGDHHYEPTITPEALAAQELILSAAHAELRNQLTRRTVPGQRVLDCILVEPNQWWVGWHTATTAASCLPGGLNRWELPYEAVSRAWLKMTESLAWSQLPIRAGDACVELGCAPGGSCQVLLQRGLYVTGIDPAEMHPAVLGHERFTHLRKRGADVRRRQFAPFRWLTADMNVAPRYTLDTVEAIVTHPAVNIRGMLLTLKLVDWSLAEEVPEYLARVKSWGYEDVRARQLQHNRQELTVAALRR